MAEDIRISFDIVGLDWAEVSSLYRVAFGFSLSADAMEKSFSNAYKVCTAWDGDRLCGAVYAISEGVLDATLHGLAVHPDYRGRGIATQMLTQIVKQLGDMSILLTTDPEHVEYYRRLGFKRHKATMALRFPDDEVE